MQLTAEVLQETSNTFLAKSGQKTNQRLVLLDSDKESRFLQTMEFDLMEEQKTAYAGKLQGRSVRIGINGINVYNGRTRLTGKILEVIPPLK